MDSSLNYDQNTLFQTIHQPGWALKRGSNPYFNVNTKPGTGLPHPLDYALIFYRDIVYGKQIE